MNNYTNYEKYNMKELFNMVEQSDNMLAVELLKAFELVLQELNVADPDEVIDKIQDKAEKFSEMETALDKSEGLNGTRIVDVMKDLEDVGSELRASKDKIIKLERFIKRKENEIAELQETDKARDKADRDRPSGAW